MKHWSVNEVLQSSWDLVFAQAADLQQVSEWLKVQSQGSPLRFQLAVSHSNLVQLLFEKREDTARVSLQHYKVEKQQRSSEVDLQ